MSGPLPTQSLPPPPDRPAFRLRHLFRLRPAARRWPVALRAGLCMAAPAAIGWAAGDVPAGLVATLGAFTALYGTDRPYRNRAALLGAVGLSLAFLVGLETAIQPFHTAALVVLVVIAVAATFLCNALLVGPPGAYMITLAGAAGTALPLQQFNSWQIGLLVLAGGALSWLVHMAPALWRPHGPESAAVALAAKAVAGFAEALGTAREDDARHAAALALHDAWIKLVALQPARARPDAALHRLRALNRDLHQLFAQAVRADPPDANRAAIAERARRLGAGALAPDEAPEPNDGTAFLFAHYGARESIAEALQWDSPALLAALRVGAAAAITAVLGAALDLAHAYWITAAAVLVLHQGFNWMQTRQRAVERMLGTLVGLALAGAILVAGPRGLWLAAVLAALQFVIELYVVRNYALAAVFITAAALTIASGGQHVGDLGSLLWARGADTVIGCTIALGVHRLTALQAVAVPIPQAIVRTLAAIEIVLGFAARGEVISRPAKEARRDLQHRAFALLKAADAGIGGTARDRQFAERMWPPVVATQRLAYRVLAICWSLEEAGAAAAPAMAAALFGPDGLRAAKETLAGIMVGFRTGTRPVAAAAIPHFLQTDFDDVIGAIVPIERC